jgi:hypothetical protein
VPGIGRGLGTTGHLQGLGGTPPRTDRMRWTVS